MNPPAGTDWEIRTSAAWSTYPSPRLKTSTWWVKRDLTTTSPHCRINRIICWFNGGIFFFPKWWQNIWKSDSYKRIDDTIWYTVKTIKRWRSIIRIWIGLWSPWVVDRFRRLTVCLCVCVIPGMDLFEEALRRWEEALTFRSKQVEDEVNCASIKTGAGDAIAEQGMEVNAGTHFTLTDINYSTVGVY